MQANEFEKNVQQLMDKFKLPPSDEVWQNVERRIQERKKKRRIFFFIISSFIGLTVAGYGILNFTRQHPISKNQINHDQQVSTSKINTPGQTIVSSEKSTGTRLESKGGQDHSQIKNRKSLVRTEEKIPVAQEDISVLQERAVKNDVASKNKVNDNDAAESGNQKANNKSVDPGDEEKSVQHSEQKLQADSVKNQFAAINNLIDSNSSNRPDDNANVDRALVQPHKRTNRSSYKVQWGINFSAGTSLITEDRFSFKGADAVADRVSTSPNNYPGGAGASPYPSSGNSPVFAFKAGIAVRKQVSPRSTISLGLQYTHVGDRIKAATAQTALSSQSSFSNLSYYYSAAPQKEHTDRFHFIELPIRYSWKINTNSKHFLSLDAGTSFGYLLSNNALVYDSSLGGIYYHDKSLLAKSHFSLSSGINYHLAISRLEVSVGPQFSFDLSKLIKSDLDKRKYLLYGGIETRIFLDRQKKQ